MTTAGLVVTSTPPPPLTSPTSSPTSSPSFGISSAVGAGSNESVGVRVSSSSNTSSVVSSGCCGRAAATGGTTARSLRCGVRLKKLDDSTGWTGVGAAHVCWDGAVLCRSMSANRCSSAAMRPRSCPNFASKMESNVIENTASASLNVGTDWLMTTYVSLRAYIDTIFGNSDQLC